MRQRGAWLGVLIGMQRVILIAIEPSKRFGYTPSITTLVWILVLVGSVVGITLFSKRNS